jgi:hypothetical protein
MGSQSAIDYRLQRVGFKKLSPGEEVTLGTVRLLYTLESDAEPKAPPRYDDEFATNPDFKARR